MFAFSRVAFVALLFAVLPSTSYAETKSFGLGDSFYSQEWFGGSETMQIIACHPGSQSFTVDYRQRSGYSGFQMAFAVTVGDSFLVFDAEEQRVATLLSFENCIGVFSM